MLVWVTALLTKAGVDAFMSSAAPHLHASSHVWGILFMPQLMLLAYSAFRIHKIPFWKNVLVTSILSIAVAIVISFGFCWMMS